MNMNYKKFYSLISNCNALLDLIFYKQHTIFTIKVNHNKTQCYASEMLEVRNSLAALFSVLTSLTAAQGYVAL